MSWSTWGYICLTTGRLTFMELQERLMLAELEARAGGHPAPPALYLGRLRAV